jgi:hypothetical protein
MKTEEKTFKLGRMAAKDARRLIRRATERKRRFLIIDDIERELSKTKKSDALFFHTNGHGTISKQEEKSLLQAIKHMIKQEYTGWAVRKGRDDSGKTVYFCIRKFSLSRKSYKKG